MEQEYWWLFIIILLYLKKRKSRRSYLTKQPCRNSTLSGQKFMSDLLNGHPRICQELFRMEKHIFLRLRLLFKEKGWLEDGRYLCVEEQIDIFLMTIGHNARNRMLQDRFQHSGETIHHYFHKVLIAMLKFAGEIIKPPQSLEQVPNEILRNPMFYPYFKDCIGAIDGTHINAIIPAGEQIPYRGRKKECTQNVMAICAFDMTFTYVIAGWKGTAHDSKIFMDTIRDPSKKFPQVNITLLMSDTHQCEDILHHTETFAIVYQTIVMVFELAPKKKFSIILTHH